MFDISDFKSRVLPPQRSNKFVVELSGAPRGLRDQSHLRDLPLYCEAADVPGVIVMTNEVRRYGYGPVEKKPYSPTFTDATLVFRGDQEGRTYRFLRDWQSLAVNYAIETDVASAAGQARWSPYEVGYKADYAVDVTITTFSDDGRVSERVLLREAFPSVVRELPLTWQASQSYAQLAVHLSFFDCRLVRANEGASPGILGPLPDVAPIPTPRPNPSPSPTPLPVDPRRPGPF